MNIWKVDPIKFQNTGNINQTLSTNLQQIFCFFLYSRGVGRWHDDSPIPWRLLFLGCMRSKRRSVEQLSSGGKHRCSGRMHDQRNRRGSDCERHEPGTKELPVGVWSVTRSLVRQSLWLRCHWHEGEDIRRWNGRVEGNGLRIGNQSFDGWIGRWERQRRNGDWKRRMSSETRNSVWLRGKM